MTLRAYLRIFRERWKLILVITVVALGIATAITAVTPKSYQATTQLYVASNLPGNASSQYQQIYSAQQLVGTFSQIVNNDTTVNKVKSVLNLSLTPSALKGKISADATPGTALLNIHVNDADPNVAAQIANEVAKDFTTYAEQINPLPAGSTTGSGSSAGTAANSTVTLSVTSPATAPAKPISPNKILNLAIGIVLGLLLGAATAIGRDVMDLRIKDPDRLAEVASAPVMGVVVDDPKTDRHPIATRAGNRNIRAENFRQLRANLQFANVDNHPRVIAITSSVSTEGKTTVAINLASTLAEAGFSVCLVDADLRRPSVAKVLGLVSPVGLTSVLIHQIELGEVLQHAGSSLYVLTSGPTPPNPSEVLASSYVRDVIRSLLDKVDYVIIDTAPLLPVADGSEVAALADGTLLVARQGLTTDSNVKRAVATLGRVDAKLLGVVLNRMPLRRNQNEYGYTYYRDNDAPTHSRGDRKARRQSKD